MNLSIADVIQRLIDRLEALARANEALTMKLEAAEKEIESLRTQANK